LFDRVCDLLDASFAGDVRRRLVGSLCDGLPADRAMARVAQALRTGLRDADRTFASLDGIVAQLDARTRRDGFHVLHDWDGRADRVRPETIAVDVAAFAADRRGGAPDAEIAAAILVDYHLFNILGMLGLRVWDAGDADANLDRLDRLLAGLQGPGGSGHRFVNGAATLLLTATAHYEPNEDGYDALLEKVRTLDRVHRRAAAIDHAVAMGCHLRFGFEASYGRDVGVMRADNVADYPWLTFSIETLLDGYSAHDAAIVEALINGLCPDPSALLAQPQLVERFHPLRDGLLEAFEGFRPGERAYSPLAFFFNFSHNVVKGLAVDAVLRGRPWKVSLNDLLTSLPADSRSEDAPEAADFSRKDAATTLMDHARRSPDRIRGRLRPAIVYDPATGRQLFGAAIRRLRASLA
jgi:hypothetical protein